MAARSPEPCQGTSETSGNSPAAPNVHFAGRKRVRSRLWCFPDWGASRARAKRGAGSRLPASAASTGAANSRNVTAEETGLPGRPKKGNVRAAFECRTASLFASLLAGFAAVSS